MNRILPMLSIALWWMVLLIIILFALGAFLAVSEGAPRPALCMTKAQARAKYPTQYLVWRTEHRCWDIRNRKKQWYVVIPLEKKDPLKSTPVIITTPTPEAPPFNPWQQRFR